MIEPLAPTDDRTLRAVVFDFDGLIIDSETTALRSWQELYAAFGETVPVEKKWVNLIGTWDAEWSPAAELEARVGHALDWDTLEPERRAREIALADEEPLLPGVADALDAAASLGLRLAVASSSSLAWVERHLLRLGIYDRFETLVTRDDVVRTKPDPELFVRALEALGVSSQGAFAFEDSLHGVVAAKAAGLKVVAVPGPLMGDRDFSAADVRLDTLADLPFAQIVAQLGW